MTTVCGLYLRMSLDRTGEELGLDRQRVACRAVAERLGLVDLIEYPETVSASRDRGADSQYGKLLADARAGRLGAVIVWDMDRLTRIPREMEDWIDLAERGLQIITVDGELDTRTDNGRMFLRIKAAVARAEVERKGARQRAANAQRRDRGLPPAGGRRAFGFTPDGMTHVEPEAALIRAAYAEVLAGGSLRGIAARWSAAGRAWDRKSVAVVLRNPRNAGLLAARWGAGPGAWPPIVDMDTWRGALAALDDAGRRDSPDSAGARRWLLSGIALCGACGATMTSGVTHRGARTLTCSASRHLARAAAPIEDYVIEVVLARLRRPDAAELFVRAAPDLAPLRTRAAALRAQRAALAGDVDLPLDTLAVRDRALRLALEGIDAQLAEAGRRSALAAFAAGRDPGEVWAGLPLYRQRAVLAELAVVTVLPVGRGTRVFQPDSVRVEPA